MTYSSDRSESGSRALLACPLPFSAAPKLSLCLPTQRGGFGPAAQAWFELDRPGVQWGPCQVCTVHIVSEASEARWGWGSPEDPWNPVHSNPGQVGAGPGSHFESHGSCEQSMRGVGVGSGFKDRLSPSMPRPGSLWLREYSEPPPSSWTSPPLCWKDSSALILPLLHVAK